MTRFSTARRDIGVLFAILTAANLLRWSAGPISTYAIVVIAAVVGFLICLSALARDEPGRSYGRAVIFIALTAAMLFSVGRSKADITGIWHLAGTTMVTLTIWMVFDWFIDAVGRIMSADHSRIVGTGAATSSAAAARHAQGAATITTYILAALALTVIGAACYLRLQAWHETVTGYLLQGRGIYEILLLLLVLSTAFIAVHLAWRGSASQSTTASRLERDDRAILRHASWAIAGASLAMAVLAFQGLQSGTPATMGTTANAPKVLDFYDLATWIGTLATLVVVIAGALVAIYAKRREDEARRFEALTVMRQAWIDHVRDSLLNVTRDARLLREASKVAHLNLSLAMNALTAQQGLELRTNPAEDHPAVLVRAAAALLHEAGLNDQLRSLPIPPTSVDADWGVLLGWVIALGQLVLKIEWITTSLGQEYVPAKVGPLWKDLMRYEDTYARELSAIAPQAWAGRQTFAPNLVNQLPVDRADPRII